uniref:Lysosomal Pro-X carboxypeptidase n=1 Tax=Ananas comosus var. bracteatus TaxID=296719 RepID=A0A6V7P1J3_ANACO|nr:unnamed protein product [Ananas comosus var. bracteatus]
MRCATRRGTSRSVSTTSTSSRRVHVVPAKVSRERHALGRGVGADIRLRRERGRIEWFAENTGFMWERARSLGQCLCSLRQIQKGLVGIAKGGTSAKGFGFGKMKYAESRRSQHAYKRKVLRGVIAVREQRCGLQQELGGILDDDAGARRLRRAHLDLKNNLSSQSSPVVLFGGSYGGMLAAWFRLKYPHVAIGALASSAPILQFDGLCSPYSFYDIVTRDFKSESENCYEVIKRSWKEMDDAINKGVGIRELKRAFNICNYEEMDVVPSLVENALVYAAMTDYPTPSNFLKPLPAHPVQKMCEAIDHPKTGNDTFSRLYGAVNIYYNYSGNVDCFALHDDDPHDTLYGWDWQSCSELLLAVGGVSNSSMFPPSPYNFTDQVADCQESNEGIPPKPHWITTEFGGFDIKRTLKRFGSNIIFFNGLRDPWSGGGVLESLSESLIAIAAHKGAHHVDLRFSTNEDPKWLTEIREKEVQIIKNWLTEYYRDSA